MKPSRWCVFDELEEVEVRGEGFTGNLDMDEATCTFRINEDEIYSKKSAIKL